MQLIPFALSVRLTLVLGKSGLAYLFFVCRVSRGVLYREWEMKFDMVKLLLLLW